MFVRASATAAKGFHEIVTETIAAFDDAAILSGRLQAASGAAWPREGD